MSEPLEDSLPLSELIAQCDALESAVVRGKLATADIVDAQKPGGAANPDMSPLGWLAFLRWLDRVHVRGTHAVASEEHDAAATERILADALTDKPVAVDCADGVTRHVYPKSYDTLRFFDSLDAELRLIAHEWRLATVAEELPAQLRDTGIAMLAPRMESLAVRLWAWILTDSRAALPFDEYQSLSEKRIPAWTRKLSPDDLIALLQAHFTVNARRLSVVAKLFPPDPDAGEKSRLTLAGFLGAITAENAPGAARRLLRSTSMGQVFTTRVTAARSAREAADSAKRRAKERD